MGIIIGSAVIPLWNMMMWDKASGTGAVVAAWVGQLCAIVVWMVAASIDGGGVSVATLGGNYPMLAGNLTAILLSGFIHICWSLAMPQNYDWQSMKDIKLIEDDQSGLDASLYGAAELKEAKDWIMKWGLGLTVVIVILWPALSVPEGVFTKGYFAFWVFISVIWGFVASATIIVLPIYESWSAIVNVLNGIMGKETTSSAKEETANEAAL